MEHIHLNVSMFSEAFNANFPVMRTGSQHEATGPGSAAGMSSAHVTQGPPTVPHMLHSAHGSAAILAMLPRLLAGLPSCNRHDWSCSAEMAYSLNKGCEAVELLNSLPGHKQQWLGLRQRGIGHTLEVQIESGSEI
eukprot:351382-Chlamydomonas_euryale.AAC.6